MCIPLCTTVVHNTARSNPDNIPTLPPDNHHSSDAVYRRRGAVECCCVCYHWPWSDIAQSNCTGLTSLTGYSSILPWHSTVSERQHTTVSVGALHLSIQRWHALASVFCVSGSTLMAIRHSHLLARWPGILSQILFRMPRTALTVFGIYLKCTCSHDTSILGVLNDNALYKSKRSLTHSNLGFMVILLHQHEFQLSSTDRQLKHRLQIKMTHTADSYLLSDYSCTIQQQKWYDKDQQRHSRWFVWLLPQSVWRQSRRQ